MSYQARGNSRKNSQGGFTDRKTPMMKAWVSWDECPLRPPSSCIKAPKVHYDHRCHHHPHHCGQILCSSNQQHNHLCSSSHHYPHHRRLISCSITIIILILITTTILTMRQVNGQQQHVMPLISSSCTYTPLMGVARPTHALLLSVS